MKRCQVVMAMASALVSVQPAFADDRSVSIEIAGSIEPRCANTGFVYPLELKDLTQAGSSSLQFQAGCNAPFQYRVQSARGAFALEQTGAVSAGFASSVPYAISVHIPLTGGGAIDDRFTSADVKSENPAFPFSTSRNAVSIQQKAEMRIVWNASHKPLLPGVYQDQLTVTLSVRP
jgi:hypothetical protein